MSEYAVETSHLTKKYGTQTSVSDVSLHIRRGHIYGLLGRNGAGKTTLMKMLVNLIQPSSGEIDVFGMPIRQKEKEILPQVGCLIESPGFYPNLTGYENLKIFATLRGLRRRDAILNALEQVGLAQEKKKLFSQYSLGMKQRLAIALAIMHDPELLILDEPVNGLDPIGIVEIRSFLQNLCRQQGKTILISSHILSEISMLADDIGIIHKGVLLEEESLEELEHKNRRHITLTVSNPAQASRVLGSHFGKVPFEVRDSHTIWLYAADLPTAELNRTLVQNGIEVSALYLSEDTLEDYFVRLTGGEARV